MNEPAADRPAGALPYFGWNPGVSAWAWGASLAASIAGVFSILGTTAEVYRVGLPSLMPMAKAAVSVALIWALSRAIARRDHPAEATLGRMIRREYGSRFVLPTLVSLVGLSFAGAAMTLFARSALEFWALIFPGLPSWSAYPVLAGAVLFIGNRGLTTLSKELVFLYVMTFSCLIAVIVAVFLTLGLPRPDLSRLKAEGLIELSRGWPAVLLLAGAVLQPAVWQRVASGVSPAARRRGPLILGLMMIAMLFLAANLAGMAASALLPPGVNGEWKVAPHSLVGGTPAHFDRVLPAMVGEESPLRATKAGLVVASAALFALIAAAVAGWANQTFAFSTLIVKDFYVSCVRPECSLREQAILSQWVMIASAAAAIALIHLSRDEGRFRPILLAVELGLLAAGFLLQLLPMVVDMLWIRRGSAIGAGLGLVVGLALASTSSPLMGLLAERYLASLAGRLEPLRAPGIAAAIGLAANATIFLLLSPGPPRGGIRARGGMKVDEEVGHSPAIKV